MKRVKWMLVFDNIRRNWYSSLGECVKNEELLIRNRRVEVHRESRFFQNCIGSIYSLIKYYILDINFQILFLRF